MRLVVVSLLLCICPARAAGQAAVTLPGTGRPLVPLPATQLVAAMDAVIARELRASHVAPLILSPILPWRAPDGYGPLLDHDRDWLRSLLARGWVGCVEGLGGPACPTAGPRTVLALDLPRLDAVGDTVVRVRLSTMNPDRVPCGWGCSAGREYSARLSWQNGNWQITAKDAVFEN